MAEEEEVKLFRTWSSPFALRIVWALKLKGVQFENVYEDLANKSSLLLEYNPIHKKVPVLLHNGRSIAESLVILEYIEETWKNHPLFPENPYDRSLARFWAKFGDDKVLQSIRTVFLKQGKEQEEAKREAFENLKYLEEELKGKKFFGGEVLNIVDIEMGWLANLLNVLEEVCGVKILTEPEFPLLSAWMQDFTELPVIKETLPDRDKLIDKFQSIYKAVIAKAASS